MSRYDIEKFDPAPDPDLVCCICQCVLDKAVECPCRHVFCQGCIERWLTNRHTCPTCRKRTVKQDLQPVLPLVQNMLNRLLMICDYRENGCLEKIMLENYEMHIKDCGYEMKICRFIKCGQKVLRMNLETHEGVDCSHRESLCGGECGLMIALSDRPTHDCMDALKAHIDEKNRMIETLKSKLQELNSLSQSLNDQLEQLRQQLDNNASRDSFSSFSGSDTDVSEFMSDQESFFDDSNDSFANQLSDNNSNTVATDTTLLNDGNDSENNNDNRPVNDVIEQVEVTVVNSLFDLSSRLERVREEMRSVLNTGTVTDNNLTEDLGMRSARIDDIIDNMSRSISDTSVHANRGDSERNTVRDEQNDNRTVPADSGADENRNLPESSTRQVDEINNNSCLTENHTDCEPQSDHSYSSSRYTSPQNHSVYSERSHGHSLSDLHNFSDHSYTATPDRQSCQSRSIHSRSPSPFSDCSDRDRSRSLASERFSGTISNTSPSPSRSPSPPPSNINSRFNSDASPNSHFSPGSPCSLPISVLTDGSSRRHDRSSTEYSVTPRNLNDEQSTGSLSPRSPISGKWSPVHWTTDENEDADGSRNSGCNWSSRSWSSHTGCSNRSRSSLLDGDEEDESKNIDDNQLSDTSDRKNRSHFSDWHSTDLSRDSSPAKSPNRYDSGRDSGSRTPASSTNNITDHTSDEHTPPRQSDSEEDKTSGDEFSPKRRTPARLRSFNGVSGNESSPRKTTLSKSKKAFLEADKSQNNVDCSPCYERMSRTEDNSDDSISYRSPWRGGVKSREREKSRRQKTAPTCESQGKDMQRFEDIRDNKTFATQKGGSSVYVDGENLVKDRHKNERNSFQRIVRNSKCETLSNSTPDSGVHSATGSSELDTNQNAKRKVSAETENLAFVDSLRKSKRIKPSTVSFVSQTVPNHSTIITTSSTPSNVNLKIDLSLFNISGQFIPTTNVTTVTKSSNEAACSVKTQPAPSHGSSVSSVKNDSGCLRKVSQRLRPTRGIYSSTPASAVSETTSLTKPLHSVADDTKLDFPKSQPQSADNARRRSNRRVVPNRQRSDSLSNRDFPYSWCDDSDSDSDQSWKPGSEKSETDDTLTEEDEIMSDSSYEVLVPKTTADLLEEYKSDDTDESWTLGDEC